MMIALAFSLGATASTAQVERTVAVTVDDLPGNRAGLVSLDLQHMRRTTQKLLEAFRRHDVPVVGMVNTRQLLLQGEPKAAARERLAIVEMWTAAGHEIGNHSHSHPDFNTTPRIDFQADVQRAEEEMARHLGTAKRMRFFRHPFLHVGLELEKRRAFESWLTEAGYTIAPVTMDNDEYMYAAAYASALRQGERDLARRLADDYVRYMEQSIEFWERVEQHVVGRPIRHVLLLHVNDINADCFDRLAVMMKRRGYRFITLDEALEDEAYSLPDDWVGRWGLSWLHRWGITAGKKRLADPDPPAWVAEAYAARDSP